MKTATDKEVAKEFALFTELWKTIKTAFEKYAGKEIDWTGLYSLFSTCKKRVEAIEDENLRGLADGIYRAACQYLINRLPEKYEYIQEGFTRAWNLLKDTVNVIYDNDEDWQEAMDRGRALADNLKPGSDAETFTVKMAVAVLGYVEAISEARFEKVTEIPDETTPETTA